MNVWVQLHDYSTTDLTSGLMEFALGVFNEVDWSTEIEREAQAIEEGTECCSAGMGFIADTGRILHIVPTSDKVVMVHYMFEEMKTVYGFFPSEHPQSVMAENVAVSDVPNFVDLHYRGEHQKLIDLTNSDL